MLLSHLYELDKFLLDCKCFKNLSCERKADFINCEMQTSFDLKPFVDQ